MKEWRSLTDYLFARFGFLEGMARVLDIGGTLTLYNESITPLHADYLAIKADWVTLGNDIQIAINKYEQQKKK